MPPGSNGLVKVAEISELGFGVPRCFGLVRLEYLGIDEDWGWVKVFCWVGYCGTFHNGVYIGKGLVYKSGLNRSHGLIDSQYPRGFDIFFIAYSIVETRPGPKIWQDAQVSLGSLSCEHPTYTS